eukprot:Hpha_TRINITY_DN2776_c0_g1::TRINITY_DN2776_c0_g1_i1::g.110358::m.110358
MAEAVEINDSSRQPDPGLDREKTEPRADQTPEYRPVSSGVEINVPRRVGRIESQSRFSAPGSVGRSLASSHATSVASYALRPAALAEPGGEAVPFTVGTGPAVVIMLNTVIGGGISMIATPYAVRELGLASFIVAEVFFACLTWLSLHLLAVVADALQCFSFQDILETCYGKWAGVLTSTVVSLNNLGILVLFLQTQYDILDVFCHDKWIAAAVLAGCIAVVLPLSALAHVDRLAWVASVCAVLCMVFGGMIIANTSNAIATHQLDDSWKWGKSAVKTLFSKGIPAVNLSWTCQFNAVPLFGSLADRSVRNMDRVSFWMCFMAATLYMIMGTAVYLFYGPSIEDDVMKNIDPDRGGRGLTFPKWTALFTEAVLGLSVLGTIPLFCIESRNMAHWLVAGEEASFRLRWAETFVMLFACYGIAVGIQNLALVLALVSVIPATVVAWLLPGLAILGFSRLVREEGAVPGSGPVPLLLDSPKGGSKFDASRISRLRCGGMLCVGFYIVILPLGLVSVFK